MSDGPHGSTLSAHRTFSPSLFDALRRQVEAYEREAEEAEGDEKVYLMGRADGMRVSIAILEASSA